MSKTLSINKSNVVVKKQAPKKTFYELYYLPNVKKIIELHEKINRVPTIADIRDLFNLEVSQAEKLYRLYISDDKHNNESEINLPKFLLKSLTHAVNMIVAERNIDIEQANKDFADANKGLTEQNQVLMQQNKNLQGDLLELQQKVNDAKIQLKENDKLVEFLKSEITKLQGKYDDVIKNMLFKTTKQKTLKVKSEKPAITTLADLFNK